MIHSDLKHDNLRCKGCKKLLYKHIASKRIRHGLREYDNDIVYSTMVDLRCGNCNYLNTIFYQADLLPNVQPAGGRFRCAPTL